MTKKISAVLIIAALLLPGRCLAAEAALESKQATYRVDFTNTETRSVSVPAGFTDGLTIEMDFGLLTDSGELIAEIYPFELSGRRFWSAPLTSEAFNRVTIGTRVIRISLLPSESERLRAESAARAAALKGAVLRERQKRLKLSLLEIGQEIAVLEFKRDRLRRDLKVKLREARRNLGEKLERTNSELDKSRDELDDLEEERDSLIEERNDLAARPKPPQSRIERLKDKITELNIEIVDLRTRIRDLRRKRRDLTEEADRRGILGLREQLSEMNMNADRDYLEIGELRKERIRVQGELNKLEIEQFE